MGKDSSPKQSPGLSPLDIEELRIDIRSLYCACRDVQNDPDRKGRHFKEAIDVAKRLSEVLLIPTDETWKLEIQSDHRGHVEQTAKWVKRILKSTFSDDAQKFNATQSWTLHDIVEDNVLQVARDYGVRAFAWPHFVPGTPEFEAEQARIQSAIGLQDEASEAESHDSTVDDAELTPVTASPHCIDSLDLTALLFLAKRTVQAAKLFVEAVEASSYKTALAVYADVSMLLSKCRSFVQRFELDAGCLAFTDFDSAVVDHFVKISGKMLDQACADQDAWHKATCPGSEFQLSRWQAERDQWWRDNVPEFNPKCTAAHRVRKSDVLDFEFCVRRLEQAVGEARDKNWTMDALNQLIGVRDIGIVATVPPRSTLRIPLSGRTTEENSKATPVTSDGGRESNDVVRKVAADSNQKVSNAVRRAANTGKRASDAMRRAIAKVLEDAQPLIDEKYARWNKRLAEMGMPPVSRDEDIGERMLLLSEIAGLSADELGDMTWADLERKVEARFWQMKMQSAANSQATVRPDNNQVSNEDGGQQSSNNTPAEYVPDGVAIHPEAENPPDCFYTKERFIGGLRYLAKVFVRSKRKDGKTEIPLKKRLAKSAVLWARYYGSEVEIFCRTKDDYDRFKKQFDDLAHES